MNHDSYIETGTSHNHCQDYVLSRTINDLTFLIGSDGCSSSKDSDVGSRLLCHVAKAILSNDWFKTISSDKVNVLETFIINAMETLSFNLNLGSSFDATLNILVVHENRSYLFMWGDGCVVRKYRDGTIVFKSLNYVGNAPYYLSYRLDEIRNNNYIQTFKPALSLNSYSIKNNFTSTSTDVLPFDKCYYEEIDNSNLSSISICSDGILSYNKDPIAVINDMVAYKSTIGEFVQRRMLRMKKENDKNEIFHYDDIFCATVNFMENEV